ncbi:MAG: helix-turn-helix domain-containing protein [Lachnospiraceae bacterium]|nr:helix-turn-helix domain-containing protein [Lachnospiraceae bacterium]
MTSSLSYEHEINFLNSILSNLHLDHHIYHLGDSIDKPMDLDLREILGIAKGSANEWLSHIKRIIRPNTIVYVTDEFFCQYIALMLPELEDTILIVGPYLTTAISIEQLLEIMEQKNVPGHWIPLLKNYYRKVSCIHSDEILVAAFNAFADHIWGEDNYSSESVIEGLPTSLEPLAVPIDPQKRNDAFSNIEAIELIYKAERDLLEAVSHGRSAKAKNLLANFPLFALEQRTEALRNLQNYTVVVNTLLRKAAEQGGVHPLYIDQLSSSFAHRIESFTRSDNFIDLWNEMIQKYCALVNKHSLKHYSLPIQKVITRIDFDLTADLSLKGTAQYLNVNASYLSKLFKKETGSTLTDYVNQKRMDHAAYLLANTYMPIASISQSCGILDDNYFTKLFRRYYDQTPTQFRQEYYAIRKP